MPISLKEYRAKSKELFMPAFQMANLMSNIKTKLAGKEGPEIEKINKLFDKVNAAISLYMFTAENVSEDFFNSMTAGIDDLSTLMTSKPDPNSETTVMDLLKEGKSFEEQMAIHNQIRKFGQMVGATAYLDEAEFNAVQEEKRQAIMQARKKQEEAEENKYRAKPVFDPEEVEGEKKSAGEWIEELQKGEGTKKEIAQILAARLLANSVRGVKYSRTGLADCQLSKKEIEKTAELMTKTPLFGAFWARYEKDARAAFSAGHGGKVDDLLAKHIKNLPGGTLPEEGIFSRYMPTALERIDVLKDKIKTYSDNMTLVSNCVAEMVVLRNMVGAEKGEKDTLKRKLTPEQMRQMREQVNTLEKDPTFQKMMKDPKVRELMVKGHGGNMLAYMRESQKKYPDMDPKVKAIMNASTIGARMDKIREEAARIAKELKAELDRQRPLEEKRDMTKTWEIVGDSKKVMAEYLALDNQSRKPVDGKADLNAGLLQDVPQEKINKQVQNREQNEVFNRMTKNISPLKATEIMENMATRSQNEFMMNLGLNQHDAILPEENKIEENVVQNGNENEKERGIGYSQVQI
ncbi:MAG: hypothetical protein J6P72_07840 [Firmicutes bacterium]|nr:hypothetical protein [Bacillota bacterium]